MFDCGTGNNRAAVVAPALEVAEVIVAAARRGATVDVDGLPTSEYGAVLDRVRDAESALAAFKARVVTAATESKAHQAEGAASPSAWLADRMKVSGREAKKQTDMARRLAFLPKTSQALADGRIGTEQAAEIVRASKRGRLSRGQLEGALLDAAESDSPEQLRIG